MEKLKVLDLFSGIGGFSLGLERTGGFETVAFCEIEPFCQAVLRKHWPGVPIFDDVRELTADETGPVDLICGGYPCQPFSLAGERRGKEDDRHLWPEVHRLVASTRPAWCLFENVAGHISVGLEQVLSDLEGEGYAAWPVVIPACAIDAPHRRDRVWIIAYANGYGQSNGAVNERTRSGELVPNTDRERRNRSAAEHRAHRGAQLEGNNNVAFAIEPRLERYAGHGHGGQESGRDKKTEDGSACAQGIQPDRCDHWSIEPGVGRVAHGIPRRVDRLKALGNAVVPQIPEIIGRAILNAELD